MQTVDEPQRVQLWYSSTIEIFRPPMAVETARNRVRPCRVMKQVYGMEISCDFNVFFKASAKAKKLCLGILANYSLNWFSESSRHLQCMKRIFCGRLDPSNSKRDL